MSLHSMLISSLEKIFSEDAPKGPELLRATALRGETLNFQLACFSDVLSEYTVEITTPSGISIHLYTVDHAPSELPAYGQRDEDYLRVEPGLFPDILHPYEGRFSLPENQWRCLWFEAEIPQDAAGEIPIAITLTGEEPVTRTFTVEVIPAALPAQTLIRTEWFHCDCIAALHNVPVFSEAHWTLLGAYMEHAVRYGINMLLTPVFTPPLDTEVGGERPTVQLADVFVSDGSYTFGFDRLKRYLTLGLQKGFIRFEISHLFTQWGAAHAPKIMGLDKGREVKLFGWETDAHSPEYIGFLNAFIPALKSFLANEGLLDRCYFHISDEPNKENAQSYRLSRDSVRNALEGCRVMDALSDYQFYEQGLVDIPVPSNDHIDAFLDKDIPERWVYYCSAQAVNVSNRFFAMPSARCRILGWQLFKYDMTGFLHWGYNFWFSQHAKAVIDPYQVTDAGKAFPSGDAFVVYPGERGPVSSLRLLTMFEAMQDLRALNLLASLTSREEVVSFMENEWGQVLTFASYPREAEALLSLRQKINKKIKELVHEV